MASTMEPAANHPTQRPLERSPLASPQGALEGALEGSLIEQLASGVRSVSGGWGLAQDSAIELLNVSENVVFQVEDPSERRRAVVRVHRSGYHTHDEIASELDWLEALHADARVATPRILPRRDAGPIASFTIDGEQHHAAAFEWIAGQELQAGSALSDPFHQLGAISARLHCQARRWRRPPGFLRKRWTFATLVGEKAHWGPWQHAIGLDAAGRSTIQRTVDRLHEILRNHGTSEARFGLIHADLRLANVLAQGDALTVIDFDDCGESWFCFDVAASLSFIEERADLPELIAAWLAGYRAVAPLSAPDAAIIPALIMLRRIQLTAWLASHGETPTARELGSGYTAGTVRLAQRFAADGLAHLLAPAN